LKQEFPITEEWLPYEIHPDTPQTGVLWADYFPGMNPESFFQQLDARGKTLGVRFGPQPLMSNSRKALEGGEFAKEHGRYDVYHEGIFKAFFTDCMDIGDRDVILNVAREAGLDAEKMRVDQDAGTYIPHLEETIRMARKNWVRAAPTCFIEGYGTITGAQPIETFRAAFAAAQKKESEKLVG